MSRLGYAPYLAAAFVLWPLVAFAGGSGFSSLLALASLPAIAYFRLRMPGLFFEVTLVLIAWILASAIWSPAGDGFVSGSLMQGTFALNAAGLRTGLTFLAAMLLVMAVLAVPKWRDRNIPNRIILLALIVHGATVLLLAVFTEDALALFDPLSDRTSEAMQNVIRNANAFALALPLVAAWMWTRAYDWIGRIIAAGVVIVSLWAFNDLGAQSAVIATAFAINAVIIVWWLPRAGFRVLLGAIGIYILAAPVLVGSGINLLERLGITLPGSFQSRVHTWQVVIDRIGEKPLIGHGMEAAKTWRETYADYPEWMARLPEYWASYPVIPGHVHNMALQLWAETGAVGALLAAAALILLAWRLPAPGEMDPTARYAMAGFTGAALVMFSFSYSLWNEAFWASLTLLSGAIILMARREPNT